MYIQKTIFLIIFFLFSTTTLFSKVYEDGSINKWEVSANHKKAEVIYDEELKSSVILFEGKVNKTSYHLGDKNKGIKSWNNKSEFLFSWKMNTAGNYKIKIYIETTKGRRYMYITPTEGKELVKRRYLYIGVGKESRNGTWKSFEVDVKKEFKSVEPDNEVLAIHGVKIKATKARFKKLELLTSDVVNPPVIDPPVDPEPPVEHNNTLKISNIIVKTISNNYKKIQWEIDKNATGQVEYGETKKYGTLTKKEDTFRFRLHRQSLRDLKSNTLYHYRVMSEDKDGNKAVSSDRTFTTEVIPLPEVDPLPSAYNKKYENGKTNEKWSIIKVDPSGKKTPLGATVSSEFDNDLNSEVIVFRGKGKSNQYLAGAKADGVFSWKEKRNFVLSWKMKISEEYRIRVFVETEKGSRIFDFTSSNNAVGSIFNEKYIGIGLGAKSKNGSWQEHKFDLAEEIQKLEADNKLLAVHGFKVMGSARIDDIVLRRGKREEPVEPPKVILKQEPLPITENLDEQMMILNEYKRDDSKPWVEFIVTGHYIDFRAAKIVILEDKKEVFSATMPELTQLGHLRQGTVLTISTEKTDMSYAPFSADGDDWILNIALSDLDNKTGTFKLAKENVTIKIVDKDGKLILPSSGSGMFKNLEKNGVIFQLHKDPSSEILPNDLSYYTEKNIHASLGIFNEWKDKEDNSFTQSFHDLRAGKELNEVGGVVVSKIKALEKVIDAESIFYLRKNNTLWIADDDSHKAFEMEFTQQKLVSEFDDVKLGNFVEEISNYCIRKDSKGICDIESIAYDEKNDIFYILSGNSHSDSGIFKLIRKENERRFTLDSFTDLGSKEFSDALFIDDDFIVVTNNGKNLNIYDYDSNTITSPNYLFRSVHGKVYGMAYYAGTLWLTTSTFKLLKVDWKSKKVEAIYDMTQNGVNDPRGIEVINNQLYILEGMNHIGAEGEVLAPLGHVLKNSIHIYTMP